MRYDGGHRLDRFLTDTLGKFVEFVPVCPEVGCGLPVPRECMRLEGSPASPRLVTINTRIDMTGLMLAWAEKKVALLEREGLSGFVFKKNSPSCGTRLVEVYGEDGLHEKTGVGLFARAFMEHFPLIPVDDEMRLHYPKILDNFIKRISCR